MANLTAEQIKQVLHYDSNTGLFYRKLKNGNIKETPSGSISKNGYILIRALNVLYYAHRLAWMYVYGSFPDKHIDHLNNVRTDNRIANLRNISRNGNNQNIRKAQKNNQTKLLGVSFSGKKKPYRARICVDGKQREIGTFLTAEEAHIAYMEEKKKYHISQ